MSYRDKLKVCSGKTFRSSHTYNGYRYELKIEKSESEIRLGLNEQYKYSEIVYEKIHFSQSTNNCQIVIASNIEKLMENFESKFFEKENIFEIKVKNLLEKILSPILLLDISEKARNNLSKVFPNSKIYSEMPYRSTFNGVKRNIVLLKMF